MLGETISHYKILEKLGEGGMGVVYKARDTKLDRTVAIKFLPTHMSADPEAKKRFVQEAKSASALDHPNICTIHEIDETEDGATFIVMACYQGQTLREIINEGPLEIDRAIDIASQISSGLAKAHENGIVHRDIKPPNIILTSDGHVKILDFGIAKLESATRITREGSTLGTAGYMSPEQAKGGETGPETDVWATGVILYEMLTGRRLFAGEHEAAVLYEVVHEEPDPLPEELTASAPGLQEIINKALAKDSTSRFKDSGEMRSAIEELRSGSIQTGKHPAKPGRGFLPKPILRWGLIGVLIAASIFILLKFAGRGDDQSADMMKIAVLPFANLGSPNDEYFSNGITDRISARLGTIQSIRVIARQSLIMYKGSDKLPKQISEELGGIDYIIGGTVQRERPSDPTSKLRIIPQITLVKDGTQVWSDTYDREAGEIFAIQSDIAEKIADALDVALLGSGEKGGREVPTRDLRAYEFYLQGQSLQDLSSYAPEKMKASNIMYEKALEIDPDYIDALVALAINSCWLAFQSYDIDGNSAKASKARDRASEIDPEDPGVFLAMGTCKYVLQKDFKGALEDFRRAFEKNPSSLETVNSMGWAQRRLGQWEEARKSLLRTKELNPGDIEQNFIIGEHLFWMRRYDEAEHYLNLAMELGVEGYYTENTLMRLFLMRDGDTDRARALLDESLARTDSDDILFWHLSGNPVVQRIIVFNDSTLVGRILDSDRQTEEHFLRAEMYNQIGETELAREYYDSTIAVLERRLPNTDEVISHYSAYSNLGFVYARIGNKEKAIEYGDLAVEKESISDDALAGIGHLDRLLMIFVVTGEYDKAFELIDRLLSMPVATYVTPNILRLDPLWDPIRDDPRFDSLIEKYSEASN